MRYKVNLTMLKCNKCSESVHKKYLVICEKCEFCYHLPCVSEFIGENKCFVCENCQIHDKKLEEINHALEIIEKKVFKLGAVKEDSLVNLIGSLRNINEEIIEVSNNYVEILPFERLEIVGDCVKKLLFCVEDIEDELKVCEDLGNFAHWIEDVGQKSVESVEEAEILLETILEGRKTLDKFLNAVQKLDNLEEDYLEVINGFRISKNLDVIQRFPNLKLRDDFSKTAKNYNVLLQRVRKFLDWFSDGQGFREETEETLTKAGKFLEDLEPKVKSLVEEPIAKESRLLKKQEKRAKNLKTQLIANKNLIDDAMEISSKFLKIYEDFLNPQELSESVKNLEMKYEDFNKAVEVKHQKIFQALTYSQENLEIWMKAVEEKFKTQEKLASLIPRVLDQQIIGQKLLITEIEAHISSLDVHEHAKELLKLSEDQEKFLTNVKKDLTVFNQNKDNLLKLCEETNKDLTSGHNIMLLEEIEENLKQKKGFLDETTKLGSKLLEDPRNKDKETLEENLEELKDEWGGVEIQLQKKLVEVKTSTNTLTKLKDKIKDLSLKLDNFKSRVKMATTEEQIKSIEEDYREIKEDLGKIQEENNFTKQLKQKNQDFLKLLYNKKMEIKENQLKIEKIKDLDDFLTEIHEKLDCLAPTSLTEAQNLQNDLQTLQLKIFEKQSLFDHFQYKTNITEKMDSTLKWSEKYREFYAIYELLSKTEYTEPQLLHLGDIVKVLLEDSRTDKSIEDKYLKLCQRKQETEKDHVGIDKLAFDKDLEGNIDDIADKLALDQLELQINNQDNPELQKKLNLKRAEIENSLIEEKEFKVACATLQGWITLKMIPSDFAISADKIKLYEQFAKYSDLQKQISEKEHEFVMLDRNNNENSSDLLQENWGKLKNGTLGRLKRLQVCKESCDLFYGQLDGFLLKLKGLEVVRRRNFDDLKPRDLSVFEQDFERLMELGEDFLKLCDVDKEGVEGEIKGVSDKWSILKKKVQGEDEKLGDICLMIGSFMGQLRELQDLPKIRRKYRELAKICSENNVNIQGITREYKKLVKEAEKRLQEIKDEELKKQKVEESLREFRGSVEVQKSKLADLEVIGTPVINREGIEEHIGGIKKLGAKIEEIHKEVKVLDLRASDLDIKAFELGLKTSDLDLKTSKLVLNDSKLKLKDSMFKTSQLETSDLDLTTTKLDLKKSELDSSEIDLNTSKLDLNDSKLNLKDSELKTSKLEITDLDLPTSKLEFKNSDLDLSEIGLNTSKLDLNDSKLNLEDSELMTSKLEISDLDSKTSKLDLKISELDSSEMDLNTSKLDLSDSKLDLNESELKTSKLDLIDSKLNLEDSELMTSKFKISDLDLKTSKLDLKISELNSSEMDLNTGKLDLNESEMKTSKLEISNLDLNSSKMDLNDSKLDLNESDLKTSKLQILDSESLHLDLKTEVKPLKLKIDELQKQVKKEEEKWGKTLQDLQEFTMLETAVKEVIENADSLDFENLEKPQLKALEVKVLEPLEAKIVFFNNLGDCLMGLTDEESKTVEVKAKLMDVNQKNQELREKINLQLNNLDLRLIEEGKIKEALEDLDNWLKDLEGTVEKLKAPSFDPKVLKTQIVEVQKLQSKLLEGRKPWLNGDEKIEERLDNLDEKLGKRLGTLCKILKASENYYLQLNPILSYIDEAQQKLLKILDLDEDDSLTEKLIDLKCLQHKNLECQKNLQNLTSELTSQLQDTEAMEVQRQKYQCQLKIEGLIKETDENIDLLEKLDKNLHSFQNFTQWLEKIEVKLIKLRQIPVFEKQLQEHQQQLKDIKEDIEDHQITIREIKDVLHLLPMTEDLNESQINNIEHKYQEILNQTLLLQKTNEDFRPMVQDFHDNHNSLKEWLLETQGILENPEISDREVISLEVELTEYKPLLDILGLLLIKMSEITPLTSELSEQLSKDTKKFEDLELEILKLSEKVAKNKRRYFEVFDEVDSLQNWLRNTEEEVNEIGRPSSDPYQISQQLTTQKQLQDHLNEKQNNIKLAIKEVQEILRESPPNEDMTTIKEKVEDLQETTTKIVKNNMEKINNLEEALELAEDFQEVHNILDLTLEEIEEQVPLISDLQENNEAQQQTTDNKPLLEKLNKSGEALIQICSEDSTFRIQELLNNNNSRYSRIKTELRNQQQNFEQTLLENSQLTDKLDGILEVLNHTATQVKNLEPIAANPEKIREQIQDNQILIEDLEKRREAYESVTEAAKTIIEKAGDLDLTDIKNKLQNLEQIWKEVQELTKKRGKSLQETLIIAQKFWDEVQEIQTSIKDIGEALLNLEPPSAHISTIKEQQQTLETIKVDLNKTTPNLNKLKETGNDLIQVCNKTDIPEIRKQIADVQENLETTTQHFLKREKNLISAMDKAMEFHDTITTVQEFLDEAEDKFQKLKFNTTNLNEVQGQLEQLRSFKKQVEPHVIKLETLTRQAQELSETTPTDHDDLVAKPLQNLKIRLDDLQLAIFGQESDLERALLDLGNFELAFNEFMAWIEDVHQNIDKIVPSIGNLENLEVELAKMQVLVKDIQGHQLIMDNLQATKANPEKLAILNFKWIELTEKSKSKLKQLEVLLKQAVKFTNEVNDELLFLEEVSNHEVFRKPVGGLQETAAEQLSNFMVIFEEIEAHRPKIEALLHSKEVNLQNLKHQWDLVTAKALDKKIKLEIALKEAQSFQDSFKEFADWLTSAEQVLMRLKPVSRLWNVVEVQMEEHKQFQKEIADHRAVMYSLDKKGSQLKYFTQREDSALIRHLLVSLQHRWDRINNKIMERALDLDQAYKEAKEFSESWTNITNWLTEAEETLDNLLSNNQENDSQKLRKIEDLLRNLKDKQNNFDRVIRLGNSLKYKALKEDLPVINEMLSKLRDKFKTLTNKTINGQRKLEKSLLQAGQYKDTIQSLTQWLKKSEKELTQENPVHGNLDFVSNLLDNHRLFIDELESRADLIESLTNQPEFPELQKLYEKVDDLTKIKTQKLNQALEDAQKLTQKIKQLTDWMTEAEDQLQNLGDIPDHENLVNQQLQFLNQFRTNLNKTKPSKDETCNFALEIIQKSNSEAIGPIKNTIRDINNQWNRISRTLLQRHQKLLLKLKFLEEFDRNLEDLIQWVLSIESKITEENQMDLPLEIGKILELMDQHKRFMKEVEKRQLQVDKICRSKPQKTPIFNRLKKTRLSQLDIKPPRVQFLHDKWREVWVLLWDRQQKLRNHLVYLKDKEKADKFSWEDWRRRFLKFMGYKKSRVVDLLKKLDKDQNDLIPSEEFIEGILRTKFDTNRLEMLQLVKIFDLENKELIDWRQFLKALRPEWEEKPTNVDDAKILTEFKKIVMMCKCKDRIKVVHVGDGRYKIGDNQKIRLVRILKSTVMVRVGGGWVTLQEFLKKNDPCRTVGRTNLELREKYLLPEGASQALAAFRSKFMVPSPKIIQGPVFKIREKTEKSLGMSYVTKTQFTYQNVQPMVRSKPNSRLGSRQNSFVKSRPASALGSRQSSFVLDSSKSRIPRLKLTNIPPPKQD